jgi:hypothetical protein
MADYWLQGEEMCPENGVLGDIDGIAAAKHMSAIHGPRLNGIRAAVDKRIGTDGKVHVIILHLTR